MSDVLNELASSGDPIARELARTLRVYQNIKASRGLPRSIGYEPQDIQEYGAIEVIERRIRNQASGFNEVPAKGSYEAIVLKYPDRFRAEIVAIAQERIGRRSFPVQPPIRKNSTRRWDSSFTDPTCPTLNRELRSSVHHLWSARSSHQATVSEVADRTRSDPCFPSLDLHRSQRHLFPPAAHRQYEILARGKPRTAPQ